MRVSARLGKTTKVNINVEIEIEFELKARFHK
jgi:hypothetical protein